MPKSACMWRAASPRRLLQLVQHGAATASAVVSPPPLSRWAQAPADADSTETERVGPQTRSSSPRSHADAFCSITIRRFCIKEKIRNMCVRDGRREKERDVRELPGLNAAREGERRTCCTLRKRGTRCVECVKR
jgi:hypothetical protein